MIHWTWCSTVYDIAGEQRRAEESKRNTQLAEVKEKKQKHHPSPHRRTHRKPRQPHNSPAHDKIGQQSTLIRLRRGVLRGLFNLVWTESANPQHGSSYAIKLSTESALAKTSGTKSA